MAIFLYEKVCKSVEKLPFPVPKSIAGKYKEAIEFSHLRVSPAGAFRLAIFSALLVFIFPSVITWILGFFTSELLLIIIAFSGFAFYYLYDYPLHYATVYRIKASSEMVLCVVYMAISMRITPNLENAIKFAAKNLESALGYDLRQLLWDIHAGKYYSADQAFDDFLRKWRRESEEFTDSLQLIKNSLFQSFEDRERTLKEAIRVVLDGTTDRMKRYGRELKNPITIINYLGILLPVLVLTLLPMMSIFMPEIVTKNLLMVSFNFLLPLVVYLMLKSYLDKRPYSFLEPDIRRHPKFKRVNELKYLIVSLAIGLPVIVFGSYGLFLGGTIEKLLHFSFMISWGLAITLTSYSFLSVFRKLKLKKELEEIEREFSTALTHLGYQIKQGQPLEKSLRSTITRFKNFKIIGFYERTLYNIETFSLNLEKAVFDPNVGAINYFPSKMVETIFSAIIQISGRGLKEISEAMITISSYLTDVHAVNENLQEVMEESTATMSFQKNLLLPISMGIVIGLIALVINTFAVIGKSLEELSVEFLTATQEGGFARGFLASVININRLTQPHEFQLIISVYLIEIVIILSIAHSTLKSGEGSMAKKIEVSKSLVISMILYSLVALTSFYGIGSIIPAEMFK